MGCIKTLLILFHVIAIGFIVTLLLAIESGFLDKYVLPPKPAIEDKFWGDKNTKIDNGIHKFEVKVPEDTLVDLRRRLKSYRPTESIDNVNFNFGLPSAYSEKLRNHWLTKYNWRAWEKVLNTFPQYKTKIRGLDIHFLHVKPKATAGRTVLPLLLLHGWPGSVLEFYKIIPMLTTPSSTSKYVFELVVPSLPGYGWSEEAKKEGMGVCEMGTMFMKLMRRLNLVNNGFYVQGGDWGTIIGECMARMYPELLRGHHSNMVIPPLTNLRYNLRLLLGMVLPNKVLNTNETWKVYPYFSKLGKTIRETGYMHLQATRPDTAGAALNDSPMGLASYIIEKFAAWTDSDFLSKSDGGISEYFTMDEMITNVMIYWTTGSITTSFRLYKEAFRSETDAVWDRFPSIVPTGALAAANDLVVCPEEWYRLSHPNLVQYTDVKNGGHFIALEKPSTLAQDIFYFANKAEMLKVSQESGNKKNEL